MKFDTNFDADPNEDDPARRAKVTEYAKAQGGWYEDSEKSAYYGNVSFYPNNAVLRKKTAK